MWLVSYRLGLIGKGDLIEIRDAGSPQTVPYPVDYKFRQAVGHMAAQAVEPLVAPLARGWSHGSVDLSQ